MRTGRSRRCSGRCGEDARRARCATGEGRRIDMGRKSGLAALGGCLGVVAGMLFGGVVGYLLGDLYTPVSVFDWGRPAIFFPVFLLCTISGAALGAGLAVRFGASGSDR